MNHRELPHDTEAEISVLGAVLIRNEVLDEAEALLRPDMFANQAHGILYGRMAAMRSGGIPIDATTLLNSLRSNKELEPIGGVSYLKYLLDAVPSAANVKHYAALVKREWQRRELDKLSEQLHKAVYSRKAVSELTALIEGELTRIVGDPENAPLLIIDAAKVHVEEGAAAQRAHGKLLGYGGGKGWGEMDMVLRGLQPGRLYVIAARPSMGKTTLAVNWAGRLAKQGNGVLMFSLEMPAPAIAGMMIAVGGGNLDGLFEGGRAALEYSDAVAKLENMPFWIHDEGGISLDKLCAITRRWKRQHGIKLMMVDYLQLVYSSHGDNREQKVASVGRTLKALAMKENIPVILLSQLNRMPEQRGNREPRSSDLRESGAVEQDADVVILLHWPWKIQQPERGDTGDESWLKLNIDKNRSGRTGYLWFRWQPPYSRFLRCYTADGKEMWVDEF